MNMYRQFPTFVDDDSVKLLQKYLQKASNRLVMDRDSFQRAKNTALLVICACLLDTVIEFQNFINIFNFFPFLHN